MEILDCLCEIQVENHVFGQIWPQMGYKGGFAVIFRKMGIFRATNTFKKTFFLRKIYPQASLKLDFEHDWTFSVGYLGILVPPDLVRLQCILVLKHTIKWTLDFLAKMPRYPTENVQSCSKSSFRLAYGYIFLKKKSFFESVCSSKTTAKALFNQYLVKMT